MEEEKLRAIAHQLRKPDGDFGRKVGENMNQGNAHINRHTIGELFISDQDQLLEIGMGNGFFVKEILAAAGNVQYTGCDFSPTMIEEANSINDPFVKEGTARFILANAETLPFADNSFNKIFTINTIYFWEDPARTLAEIYRVLSPAGKLVISVRPRKLMQYYPFIKYGFTLYSGDELSMLLSDNHFKVTGIIEKSEPDQELNGQAMKVETLMVTATK